MCNDMQQVCYNGKSTELVSQLARTALQQSISDMWRCTSYYKHIVGTVLQKKCTYIFKKKQHIGDMIYVLLKHRVN